MKNIYWGRVKNYDQWYFKFYILYFEYCSYNMGYGLNILPRLFQWNDDKNKDTFRPVAYLSLYLGLIGSLDISINNRFNEW